MCAPAARRIWSHTYAYSYGAVTLHSAGCPTRCIFARIIELDRIEAFARFKKRYKIFDVYCVFMVFEQE